MIVMDAPRLESRAAFLAYAAGTLVGGDFDLGGELTAH
jgi:hypothetical protein